MKRNVLLALVILLAFSLLSASQLYRAPAKDRISNKLAATLAAMDEHEEIAIWVFFSDKGIFDEETYRQHLDEIKHNMSERRKRRREKTGRAQIVDFTDIPVDKNYVSRLESMGLTRRIISNWFNAASFSATKEAIHAIKDLTFVQRIDRVERFHKRIEPYKPVERKIKKLDVLEGYQFNYGYSKTQDSLIAVDQAHSHGYFGEGIRIGIFDTGFWVDSTRFEALGVVSKNIIDTWDFINDSAYVGPRLGDPAGQIDHGTSMLSLIAGFKDNELIGPAFNAGIALAKTERVDVEILAEEDYWAAAAEWADSCGHDRGGVDIISSSLGYRKFPQDTMDYTYRDMNGDSAKITRAADLAVSKGIVVVSAMGNVKSSSPTDRPDTMIVAPADGDSVIAAGAVNFNFDSNRWEWAWFLINGTGYGSIIGPPYHDSLFPRRIKPDVCASWTGYHTNPEYDPEAPDTAQQYPYVTGQGTSVSTAMLAGGCALILEAHPNWAPMKLRKALTSTASNAAAPDDTLGWGIANIWDAINYEDPEISPFEYDELLPCYPNPYNPDKHTQVVIPYNIMNQGLGGTIHIHTLSGRKVKIIDLGNYLLPGRYATPATGAATWDGMDEDSKIVDAGIYVILLRTGYKTSVRKLAIVR
jgi:serine protease AprX